MKNMKPINIDEQLDSIRMTPAQRLEAEAALRRGEVIANLIHGAGRLIRRGGTGVTRLLIHGAGRLVCRGAAGVTRAYRRAARAHLKLYAEIYR